MINLINVEEPLRNALEIISEYCKHNDCKTCGLNIDVDLCITEIYPESWWMYILVDEPQTKRPCENCQEWDCYGCDYKQTERSE